MRSTLETLQERCFSLGSPRLAPGTLSVGQCALHGLTATVAAGERERHDDAPLAVAVGDEAEDPGRAKPRAFTFVPARKLRRSMASGRGCRLEMHADSDVNRYAKLDQALLQERSGQVIPEFNPSVAIAGTAAELLKEDIAFAPQRRIGRPEVD
jgi:hypothetical protein